MSISLVTGKLVGLVEVEVAHDAGVVDQHVESRKLAQHPRVERSDGPWVGDVALEDVEIRERPPRLVELAPLTPGHRYGVATLDQPARKLQADAAGAASDQDRPTLQFHDALLRVLPS